MVSIIIPACDCTPNTTLLEEALKGLEYEIIVEHDYYREGKGITLQRGFNRATGEIIVWLDADMEIKPSAIPEMISLLNRADIVVGSKMHKKSKVYYPWGRYMVSKLGHYIIRVLFGIPLGDTQTGLKVFKRKALEGDWKIEGFGHDVEVLLSAHLKGLTILEYPVVIRKQNLKESFITILFRTFKEILWLKWRMIRG